MLKLKKKMEWWLKYVGHDKKQRRQRFKARLQQRSLEEHTKVVLPAPCTPFNPRKNGGALPPFFCLWASSLWSKNGIQCSDLSSVVSISNDELPSGTKRTIEREIEDNILMPSQYTRQFDLFASSSTFKVENMVRSSWIPFQARHQISRMIWIWNS